MLFMSDIKNEVNEEGESDIGVFEVQVCDVHTSHKPFMMRWWYVSTCVAQVIRSFSSRKKLGY